MLTEAEADEADRHAPAAPEPPLGSWRAMYVLVMAWAVVLIALFSWFQSAYA